MEFHPWPAMERLVNNSRYLVRRQFTLGADYEICVYSEVTDSFWKIGDTACLDGGVVGYLRITNEGTVE